MFFEDEKKSILTFEEWKLENPISIAPQIIQLMIENHCEDIDAEIDIIHRDRYNQYVEMMNDENKMG